MPFKFNADGTIAVDPEKKLPIFVHGDGRETPLDGDHTLATIARLGSEAKGHREGKEAAETRLKAFEGIEDGEAARKALELAKNIKDGDLITAGKVQEIKDAAARSAQEAVAAATRAAQEKEKALTEQNAKLTGDLNNHIIGGSFAGSKFISEKLAIPHDMAQSFFGSRFKVDGGKLVALDQTGNPIFSATDHGNHAGFDEAIQIMVSQYPNRDLILKGSGASGGGASGNGGSAGGKTINRAQFDGMDQGSRASFFKDGGRIEG